MKIIYARRFQKLLRKLGYKVKLKFDSKIEIFRNDKYDVRLNNHKLQGKLSEYRSINITGDIRALYYEKGDEIIIFALIGSHSELY